MVMREQQWLESVGIEGDLNELYVRAYGDNPTPADLALCSVLNAASSCVRAETVLVSHVGQAEDAMKRLRTKLATPGTTVNSLGELQNAAQINAMSGEYAARHDALKNAAHLYNKQMGLAST